ncbi:SGS-domain-containing protein [Tothia fuscella]|uniref:SGS-domain-containing protein n=1 Tax=Tothia fuscella TaxID=1048955 RepID=A0A9P4U4B8_9PEZI|nr:SGS-domain-containing protein [Tothia fuscella]
MDAATRGSKALEAGEFDKAIAEYTSALKSMPTAVDYYLKRSSAYQRSSPPQYGAALADVELAVHLAIKRAKRELIGQAQLRRAITLFNMGKYADAQFILTIVKKYDEKNKTLPIWESKIATKFKTLPEDDPSRVVSVKEIPDVEAADEKKKETSAASEKKETSTAAKVLASAPTAKVVTQTPPSQIKHDWYQNNENIYFTLLAKGVPKELATIEIEESSINISFPTQTGSDYTYALDPLFAPINTSASTFNITGTKIELVLKKQTPGVKWRKLEGDEAPAPSTSDTAAVDPVRQAVLAGSKDILPSPYASKKGVKNWDKVVDDIAKESKAEAGKEGGGDEFDDDEDPQNAFFKHLYKNADENTRRAINKSYQESGGTVLSTNWDEVSKGTVEVSPPDGMVAKKWNE